MVIFTNAAFYRIFFYDVVLGRTPPNFKFVARANRQITDKNLTQFMKKFIAAVPKLEHKLVNILI